MTIDRSLKVGNRLVRARSVLTRAERIATLRDKEEWEEGRSIFGLPKVRVRQIKKRAKAPKAEEAAPVDDEATLVEGAEEQA